MNRILLLVCTVACAMSWLSLDAAGGQHAPAKPFSLEDSPLLRQPAARTPLALDEAGAGLKYAHAIYGRPCQAAVLGSLLIPAPAIVQKAYRTFPAVTASSKASFIADLLTRGLRHLDGNGDTVVRRHHLCVAMVTLQEGPNAAAHPAGYVLVDPRFVQLLLNPDGSRMLSDFEEFIYYHELAHSLQFWNPSLRFRDAIARRDELAADCTAAAMSKSESNDFFVVSGLLLQQAFREYAHRIGDDNPQDEQHHGTPEERARAVVAGEALVDKRRQAANGSTMGITSTWLLSQCNAAIKQIRPPAR